jgi:hypothetical protein
MTFPQRGIWSQGILEHPVVHGISMVVDILLVAIKRLCHLLLSPWFLILFSPCLFTFLSQVYVVKFVPFY